jgi:hypothetical protein
MTITNARAIFGLFANATPTRVNVGTQQTIGEQVSQVPYTATKSAFSVGFTIAHGSSAVVDLADNDTSASDAWVAGVAQVETATAAGTITGSGNASVVVTAAGMTGSPKTISVPVLNGDTASVWAGKVRNAIAADSAVSALFTIGGTTTAIQATRKPTATVNGINFFPGDDATLNISLDNGTCTGITTAATSSNTTAGVLTEGVIVDSGGTEDFEGNTITPMTKINGVLMQVVSGTDVEITSTGGMINSDPLTAGSNILLDFGNTGRNPDVLTIDATTNPAQVVITAVGFTV